MAELDVEISRILAEFLTRGGTLQRADILRWRHRARTALEAWRRVDEITSELLREIDKTEEVSHAGMVRKVVPDGSGRPGHYVTAWVPKEDNDA